MIGDGDENRGTSLTEAVGTAAKVADTSVMKDLFGRAFKAAGDYYGEQIEDFFSQRRARRLKNVRDHETQVAQVIGQPVNILGKPERAGAIERWAEIAADVPLEDAERAALLEAVLAQILSTHGTSDFQDVADRLSSSGMRVLLNAPSTNGIAPEGDDRQSFERLRSLGLARTLDLRQALAVILAWLLGTGAGLFILFLVIPRYLPRTLAIEFVVEAVLISSVVLALGIALLSTKYRLTEFGRSLQQSALRFYSDRSTLRKLKILSAVPGKPLVWCLLAALFACALPPALELYLPVQLRTGFQPTVRVTSAPDSSSGALLVGPPPVTSTPQSTSQETMTLTADQARTLVDVWRSVKEQMDDIVGLTNAGQALLPNWPQRVREGGSQAFANELVRQRNLVNQRRVSLQSLFTAYQRYPNVGAALAQVATTGVFDRLSGALESFSHEVQNLPAPLPKNFENTLRPYAGELKGALDTMAQWADSTRNFAKLQGDELSKAQLK